MHVSVRVRCYPQHGQRDLVAWSECVHAGRCVQTPPLACCMSGMHVDCSVSLGTQNSPSLPTVLIVSSIRARMFACVGKAHCCLHHGPQRLAHPIGQASCSTHMMTTAACAELLSMLNCGPFEGTEGQVEAARARFLDAVNGRGSQGQVRTAARAHVCLSVCVRARKRRFYGRVRGRT